MKDDSRGVSYVGEKMKTQAISMQSAYITRKNSNSNPNFGNGCRYVAVPVGPEEDTFVQWAGKNIVTAAAVSLIWDLGTNVVAKFSENVPRVSAKNMLHNIPKVAGVFLLVGGIFKAVSNIMDSRN